jgi:hypothetical protein
MGASEDARVVPGPCEPMWAVLLHRHQFVNTHCSLLVENWLAFPEDAVNEMGSAES